MTEKYSQPYPNPSGEHRDIFFDVPAWQRCGALMAEHFTLQQTPTLLLDMDGVVLQSDSLFEHRLTTPDIIPALADLEKQGVMLGAATSRSTPALDYLRGLGLAMQGPAILEEGQKFLQGEHEHHIALPGHKDFIDSVKETFTSHPRHAPSWQDVQNYAKEGEMKFCTGNFQWQGELCTYFWFYYHNGSSYDREILQTVFEPTLQSLAYQQGLDFENDVAVGVSRMIVDNLAIVTIKGRRNGEPIHKGIAAQRFMRPPWVFVADGFGDMPLAEFTKTHPQGTVIGIEGNLDVSDEVPQFLHHANAVIKNPDEFVQALSYTSTLLRKN
ncbi:MAG TPA: hypothetical protein VLF68_04500 [Candidatus Saccharimonadales bacterium]|nr:hypothetical protein [Candidatus Saccharimonadales bacterium]